MPPARWQCPPGQAPCPAASPAHRRCRSRRRCGASSHTTRKFVPSKPTAGDSLVVRRLRDGKAVWSSTVPSGRHPRTVDVESLPLRSPPTPRGSSCRQRQGRETTGRLPRCEMTNARGVEHRASRRHPRTVDVGVGAAAVVLPHHEEVRAVKAKGRSTWSFAACEMTKPAGSSTVPPASPAHRRCRSRCRCGSPATPRGSSRRQSQRQETAGRRPPAR